LRNQQKELGEKKRRDDGFILGSTRSEQGGVRGGAE